jgi:hypothetical protein
LPPNQLQQKNIKMFTGRPITLLAVLFIAMMCYDVAHGLGTPKKCCGCCTQNSVGINNNCVIIGLVDLLARPPECEPGSTLVCTGGLCQAGQTCNLVDAGNLVCVNIG